MTTRIWPLLRTGEPDYCRFGLELATEGGSKAYVLPYLPACLLSSHEEVRRLALELLDDFADNSESITRQLVEVYCEVDREVAAKLEAVLSELGVAASVHALHLFCESPSGRAARLIYVLEEPVEELEAWVKHRENFDQWDKKKKVARALLSVSVEFPEAFRLLTFIAEEGEDRGLTTRILEATAEEAVAGSPKAEQALATFYARNPRSELGEVAKETLQRLDVDYGATLELEGIVQSVFALSDLERDERRDVLQYIALTPSPWEPFAFASLNESRQEAGEELVKLAKTRGGEILPLIVGAVKAELVSVAAGANALEALSLGADELERLATGHAEIVGDEYARVYKDGLVSILAKEIELLRRSKKRKQEEGIRGKTDMEQYWSTFEEGLISSYREVREQRGLPPDVHL